jgi:hypothetical protein
MTEYDLTDLGIADPLNIEGALTKLRVVAGAPVVFLLDEHHNTPLTITQNIQNAEELVNEADVTLITSESHFAGMAAGVATRHNLTPQFAEHFAGQAGLVVEGVESEELSLQLNLDVGNVIWPGITVRTHPNDRIRSHYFIGGLFRARRQHALDGNAILNAGGHHNDDIAEMINWGEIDALVGVVASYVRIRPTAYP